MDCLRSGHDVGDGCPESLAVYRDKVDQFDVLIARLSSTRDELARRMHTAARRGLRPYNVEEEAPQMLPQPDPLPGRTMPALVFQTIDGEQVQLDTVSTGRWVLYLYPLTGKPDVDMPRGWDQIPGARGCSQEACGFRDNLTALQQQGAQQVLALSTDLAEYQQHLVHRLHLPYPMLSDPELCLARALDLPTFHANGLTLYKRLTLVIDGDQITHVFYPIFPPDSHASEVLQWLSTNPTP